MKIFIVKHIPAVCGDSFISCAAVDLNLGYKIHQKDFMNLDKDEEFRFLLLHGT